MPISDVVKTVLGSGPTSMIDFVFVGHGVTSSGFQRVNAAIDNGDITIRHVPSLGNKRAAYNYLNDEFKLGFTATSGDSDREALIVHEAVHAIFDVRSTPMKLKYSEGAAYVAQCLYFYQKHKSHFDAGNKPTFGGNKALEEAWKLSVRAQRSCTSYTSTEAQPLFQAIDQTQAADGSKPYEGRGDDNEGYNGV